MDNNNLHYIDINNYLKFSTELIRDSVHTTELGASKYSEIIFQEYNKIYSSITIPLTVIKTKYCDIKKIIINKQFYDKLDLSGNCTIIGFNIIIGPNSGYIKNNDKEYLLWDIWCHYERKSTKMSNININGKTTFEVLQKKVNYSNCARQYDFSKIKFELNILSIYYIGESLMVLE